MGFVRAWRFQLLCVCTPGCVGRATSSVCNRRAQGHVAAQPRHGKESFGRLCFNNRSQRLGVYTSAAVLVVVGGCECVGRGLVGLSYRDWQCWEYACDVMSPKEAGLPLSVQSRSSNKAFPSPTHSSITNARTRRTAVSLANTLSSNDDLRCFRIFF